MPVFNSDYQVHHLLASQLANDFARMFRKILQKKYAQILISPVPAYTFEFTNSVHEVFSSTFEANPFRRGKHPFHMALLVAIDTGIHTIRAGRHLCD